VHQPEDRIRYFLCVRGLRRRKELLEMFDEAIPEAAGSPYPASRCTSAVAGLFGSSRDG
jgi:hypothetical protein